jgi:hypothetical protein
MSHFGNELFVCCYQMFASFIIIRHLILLLPYPFNHEGILRLLQKVICLTQKWKDFNNKLVSIPFKWVPMLWGFNGVIKLPIFFAFWFWWQQWTSVLGLNVFSVDTELFPIARISFWNTVHCTTRPEVDGKIWIVSVEKWHGNLRCILMGHTLYVVTGELLAYEYLDETVRYTVGVIIVNNLKYHCETQY